MKPISMVIIATLTTTVACSTGKSAEQESAAPAAEQTHEEAAEHDRHEHHESGEHRHHFDDPEKFAERWNASERDEWQKPAELIELLEIEPGMTVADLGAGTGYFIGYLAEAVGADGKVLALDVEEAMIEYLDERKEAEGWTNVEAKRVPFDRPGVEEGSLDRLVTINTWHHIEDREAYAEKVAATLRPGGIVVVVDYEPEWEGHGPPPEMRLQPAQIEAELAAGGFDTEIVDESLPRQYIVVGRKR